LAALTPWGQLRAGRRPRRLVQLVAGLTLYGVSIGMLVRGGLGLPPWDVLTVGLVRHLPLSFGQVVIATSFVVLLLWVPLRQLPGLGTLLNAVLIGVVADATLARLAAPDPWAARGALLVGGILLNGVAGAMYIGSQFGPGPRDGLMTGLVRRTGRSVRVVRTVLEVTVLGTGWLLGGTAGVGTVLYALGIGPLVHALLPRLTVALPEPPGPPDDPQRLVAMSTDASGATMTSTVVNRSSVSQFSRSTSTRPS
jgi:uncharacterized membrane protein YczE